MDVVFLHSNESSWKEHLKRAIFVLNRDDIKVVDGSNSGSLLNAYDTVFEIVQSEYFMMIEGDNYILDETKKYLEIKESMKFWTTNKFNVQYEHGGIKIMNTNDCWRQLKSNNNIYKNFEISSNLLLKTDTTILSEHRFDWSPKNEWITIAKELIKLHLWGHYDHLNRWIKHPIPAKIYEEVLIILKDQSFTQLFETLLPSLGEIYDSKFKK